MFGPEQSAAWRRGASVTLVQPEPNTPPRDDAWQLVAEWQALPGAAMPVTVAVDLAPRYRTVDIQEPFFGQVSTLPPIVRELWAGFSVPVTEISGAYYGVGWDGALKIEYGSGGGIQELICDVRSGTIALPASEHVRVSAQRWNLRTDFPGSPPLPVPQESGDEVRLRVAIGPSGAASSTYFAPTWTMAYLGQLTEGNQPAFYAPPRARTAAIHVFNVVGGGLVAETTEPVRGAQHAFTDFPLGLAVPGVGGIGRAERFDAGWASLGGWMVSGYPDQNTVVRWDLAP
jgi:hypothetical protein